MGPIDGPPRYDPIEIAERVRDKGMSPGLAINPPTHPDYLADLLEHVDLLLVMSVNPGKSGQAFIPDALETARAIRAHLRPDQRLQIDGGIGPETAHAALDAGCDVLVAASAIFGKPADRRLDVIRSLRGAGAPQNV